MFKRTLLVTLMAAGLLAHAALRAQTVDSDEANRLRDAVTVFNEIMATPDQAIPSAILAKAEGIAIFPSTIKAGFVVGATRGRGVLSARRDGVWSSPTFLTMTGGSIGLQIGAQATDIVLVINDKRGLENLVRNQFKLGADASAAAGPVGRDASASTDLQLRAQILSYSRARGLFAGVTINGSTIRTDRDANGRFYGTRFTGTQIVIQGQADQRPPVPEWLAVLNKYGA